MIIADIAQSGCCANHFSRYLSVVSSRLYHIIVLSAQSVPHINSLHSPFDDHCYSAPRHSQALECSPGRPRYEAPSTRITCRCACINISVACGHSGSTSSQRGVKSKLERRTCFEHHTSMLIWTVTHLSVMFVIMMQRPFAVDIADIARIS